MKASRLLVIDEGRAARDAPSQVAAQNAFISQSLGNG